MVPGPATIFSGHSRLLPGHYLQAARGTVNAKPYWRPTFSEDGARSVPTLAPEFHGALRQGVGAFAGEACGTFLSGGTDSSTISGFLAEVTGAPARTYSIGFEATGYDEMGYARIAARHFSIHSSYFEAAYRTTP